MSVALPDVDSLQEPREVVSAELALEAMKLIAGRHSLGGEPRACARGSDLVYSFGDSAVAKLTAPTWAAQIETEIAFLRAVGGKLGVATAAVLGSGEVDGWPYVVMSMVPGVHLDEVWPDLDHRGRLAIARQIGRLIVRLRDIEVADIPSPDWNLFIGERRADFARVQRRRGATESWVRTFEEFLASYPDPFAGELPTATLHTELVDTHLLVQKEAGAFELSGLIDFADGMLGAPSYEIAGLVDFVFRGERGLLAACLEAAGSPVAFDEREGERLLACALMHRYASVPRMLKAAGIDASAPADASAVRRALFA